MAALFSEESYIKRMKNMFRGLHAPRDTREYKIARLELQRLAAPTAALVVPLVAVLMLAMFAVGRAITTDRPITITTSRPEPPPPDLSPLPTPKSTDTTDPVPTTFVPVELDPPTDLPPATPHPGGDVPVIDSPFPVRTLPGADQRPGRPGPRGPDERIRNENRFDADPRNDSVILRALRWLKKNQQPDGSWRQHQAAMTGLAILTFLAHDERPGDSREFGETVRKGVDYLLKTQDERGFYPGNYEGLIATYALCETVGMTQNPNVRLAAEKAVAFIVAGQHPSGGFDYGMKPGDRDDTSVMGWAVQALKAAQIAGIRVEGLDRALKMAVRGFRRNASPNGGFGYTEPGQGGLSAVGTLAFQMLQAADAPEVVKTLSLMDAWKPSWEAPTAPGGNAQYYFYYATQTMFHAGGKRWKRWNDMMKAAYIAAQKVEPRAIADADGKLQDIGWWENGDQLTDRPVMDTCLAALQLMVYYRYLPSFQPQLTTPMTIAHGGDEQDLPVNSGAL